MNLETVSELEEEEETDTSDVVEVTVWEKARFEVDAFNLLTVGVESIGALLPFKSELIGFTDD